MSEQREDVVRREVYRLVDDEEDELAAAVIRTYGDERHAAGYQAAIADVVEWLVEREKRHSVFTWYGVAAHEITRRFGKGQ